MSMVADLAFYAKNYGFCCSKIKAAVNDASLYGRTVTALRNGQTIGTAVVGDNGIAEILTDEAGEITLTAHNGVQTATTTVNITFYGTYYAELELTD